MIRNIFELFQEFEQNKTPEAKFVKELDKLEMVIQADYYEKLYRINLQTFFDSSKSKIKNKYQKLLFNKLNKLRKK